MPHTLQDVSPLSQPVELVAMAPAGDVFFVRRADGDVWLVPPPATAEPRLASVREVEDALARHDFDVVQESFPSWAELEDRLQQRAGWVTPDVVVDVQEFDEDDVRDVLEFVEEWIDQGHVRAADDTLIELVDARAVRRSDQLSQRVQALLRRTRQPAVGRGTVGLTVDSKAFDRVNGPLLAAA